MDEYLPEVYLEFTQRYPEVAEAQGTLAGAVDDAIPFRRANHAPAQAGAGYQALKQTALSGPTYARASPRAYRRVSCAP